MTNAPSPSMFPVFRSWRQWEEMGAGKTDHTYIFTCLSLNIPCSLRAWNRLHSSKIHKTLIMQKCPNLNQQELKYQEFLHPVGKKANTSLREPILKQL